MAEHDCSFCGKRQDQVKKLIAGPKGVFICDDCVALCKEIIDEEFSGTPRPEPTARRNSWLDWLRRMAARVRGRGFIPGLRPGARRSGVKERHRWA